LEGGNFAIEAMKIDDLLNGVSTLDLIYMQRHILGLEAFDEPFEYIAGDINDSGSISGADIFELRNLLLGIKDTLKSNESWKFIQGDHIFLNPVNPQYDNLSSAYYVESLYGNKRLNFKGVKIGDLNGSAIVNSTMVIEPRSAQKVELFTEMQRIEKGQRLSVPVILREDTDLHGMQFTLSFDQGQLIFENIEDGALSIGADNYGRRYEEEGIISFSWNNNAPERVDANTILFYINFRVENDVASSMSFELNSDLLTAEWYEDINSIKGIEFRNSKEQSFELLQNKPNPWSNITEFSYSLPEASDVNISIRDIHGRMLKHFYVKAKRGINKFVINQNDFEESGILIFELDYNGRKLNKKMIKIK